MNSLEDKLIEFCKGRESINNIFTDEEQVEIATKYPNVISLLFEELTRDEIRDKASKLLLYMSNEHISENVYNIFRELALEIKRTYFLNPSTMSIMNYGCGYMSVSNVMTVNELDKTYSYLVYNLFANENKSVDDSPNENYLYMEPKIINSIVLTNELVNSSDYIVKYKPIYRNSIYELINNNTEFWKIAICYDDNDNFKQCHIVVLNYPIELHKTHINRIINGAYYLNRRLFIDLIYIGNKDDREIFDVSIEGEYETFRQKYIKSINDAIVISSNCENLLSNVLRKVEKCKIFDVVEFGLFRLYASNITTFQFDKELLFNYFEEFVK